MNKHSYNLFNLWSTLLNLISFNCLNQTLQETDHDQIDNTTVCLQNKNDAQNVANKANNEKKEASVLTKESNSPSETNIIELVIPQMQKDYLNEEDELNNIVSYIYDSDTNIDTLQDYIYKFQLEKIIIAKIILQKKIKKIEIQSKIFQFIEKVKNLNYDENKKVHSNSETIETNCAQDFIMNENENKTFASEAEKYKKEIEILEMYIRNIDKIIHYIKCKISFKKEKENIYLSRVDINLKKKSPKTKLLKKRYNYLQICLVIILNQADLLEYETTLKKYKEDKKNLSEKKEKLQITYKDIKPDNIELNLILKSDIKIIEDEIQDIDFQIDDI
ncbi:hypothetical protein GVAV_003316 [Gurleya vavrai]